MNSAFETIMQGESLIIEGVSYRCNCNFTLERLLYFHRDRLPYYDILMQENELRESRAASRQTSFNYPRPVASTYRPNQNVSLPAGPIIPGVHVFPSVGKFEGSQYNSSQYSYSSYEYNNNSPRPMLPPQPRGLSHAAPPYYPPPVPSTYVPRGPTKYSAPASLPVGEYPDPSLQSQQFERYSNINNHHAARGYYQGHATYPVPQQPQLPLSTQSTYFPPYESEETISAGQYSFYSSRDNDNDGYVEEPLYPFEEGGPETYFEPPDDVS
jgi:hypothetical protein